MKKIRKSNGRGRGKKQRARRAEKRHAKVADYD